MKVLMYWPENDVLPKGGPRGYLYNLSDGLSKVRDSTVQIDFLPSSPSPNNPVRAFVRDHTPTRLRELRRLHSYLNYRERTVRPTVDLNSYDIVHFHQVQDLYFAREALQQYHGKVILTSHTPCAPHLELISRLNPNDVRKHQHELNKLSQISAYAFDAADFIIFPCAEAEEPYYNTWDEYGLIHAENEEKYRYLLTGIKGCNASKNPVEIRNQYGIPAEAFVISYAGRHNQIKGYDRLVNIVSGLLADDQNIWVLVAGKESTIKPPKSNRWIEVGWTNDPHSLIHASDVFCLPNRETYFDLAMLEALSLGVPVVSTATGGNRVFNQLTPNAICLANDDEAIRNALVALRNQSKKQRNIEGETNYQLFSREFTSEVFTRRYINTIKEL